MLPAPEILSVDGTRPKLPTELHGEILWASLAVLLDGEGCIRIARSVGYGPLGYSRYSVMILVTNTKIEWMQAWKNATGFGAMSRPQKGKAHWRPRVNWRITNRDEARTVLQRTLPYLFGKREQAKLALEFLDRVVSYKNRDRQIIPDEELLLRDELFQKMKWLNRRGNDVSSGPSALPIRPKEPVLA